MGAFLFSWDALLLCFFILLSAGIWQLNQRGEASAKQKVEGVGGTEAIVYTEKTLQVPIRAVGVPSGEQLLLLPDEVEVSARVTCDAFSSLSASDFQVECRYPTHEADQLAVTVKCEHSEVASFRFTPEMVEFIIEKANP